MIPFAFAVKDDGLSDGEDDGSTDALVEEMLQQGDTAVIYPEAPEDEPQRSGTPDTSVHDENGTYARECASTHSGHHTAHTSVPKTESDGRFCSFTLNMSGFMLMYPASRDFKSVES